jgi:hypothetical protein
MDCPHLDGIKEHGRWVCQQCGADITEEVSAEDLADFQSLLKALRGDD